ncbi:MAG: stage 0 sporulation protein [Ruminococcaceae bacterium]|nr:stage 0 sporulation protein [Oscillospiraceae bacterium]
MVNIVGVRFKKNGKTYYFNPKDLELKSGMHVIVETARGIEYGEVSMDTREASENEVVTPLKDVLRIATEEDDRVFQENVEKAKKAYDICLEKIAAHKLEMKLIDVEYTFDNNKVLFYFTADGRIDFRELVKDLAAVFRTRIELRQVGVRDEAKTLGGLGVCGRALCCSSCLSDFQPVSIKMAKEQGMSLSPTKISGTCGRLMCCLKYEQEAYEDAIKRVPGVGSLVETQQGKGVVTASNLLRETVQVKFEKGNETELVTFPVSEIKVLSKKSGHYSNAAAAIPAEDGEIIKE